jgi:hypothetical protein
VRVGREWKVSRSASSWEAPFDLGARLQSPPRCRVTRRARERLQGFRSNRDSLVSESPEPKTTAGMHENWEGRVGLSERAHGGAYRGPSRVFSFALNARGVRGTQCLLGFIRRLAPSPLGDPLDRSPWRSILRRCAWLSDSEGSF